MLEELRLSHSNNGEEIKLRALLCIICSEKLTPATDICHSAPFLVNGRFDSRKRLNCRTIGSSTRRRGRID
jgi:hypothetical protein